MRALGKAVGTSHQMIAKYEKGSAPLPPETFAKIAVELRVSEFNVNGYHFLITPRQVQSPTPASEQLKLDFDKEMVFPGATIKITPTKVTITITATAPLQPAA